MQAVYNIAEICARHGITDVVLSPGSRSAPLTLAFARHPGLNVRVVPDERAAAFIGLGIAQAQRRAVALVCTSGTAGLNYAPAVAEAFFQQIPLVIFTADRPPEWIDQLDGQTIRQHNLYGAHAKGAFEFPVDTTHPDAKWYSARIVNEAINLAQAAPAGPVQVNVPLREPIYPKPGEEIQYEQDVKIIRDDADVPSNTFYAEAHAAPSYNDLLNRILVVVGQHISDSSLAEALKHFAHQSGATVVADSISNLSANIPTVMSQDIFLSSANEEFRESLRPSLLITLGKSLISKSLKLYLRKYPAEQQWHLQPHGGQVADVFRSLTKVIRTSPFVFLSDFAHEFSQEMRVQAMPYGKIWRRTNQQSSEFINHFFTDEAQPFNEFSAFRHALAALPETTALHLANSMAVRYANILGLPQSKQIEVFANRGTSGIDGCNSTAVGAALAQPERPVVLLTGDVAFFYDRNAFWHNYPVPNLRVVLFNNHGGGIFRIIDGPRQQPELEEFFETRQLLTAENTAKDFNLRYFPVSSFEELEAALPVFFAAETGAAILEVFTDSMTNAAFFEEYRAAVKQAFS
ncbi:2-succinyl-5-enolpyruvyl-6-hydroxy-3-cyclohexene-1-carboxylic-acid synthase [Hymenobacter artigasi]|uniref:2-succinyl-5-enolpyruvyl-6-hydroxy-3-cyclohexene-1-carboxylate synthase n=1 Tax=Hymenobacter artigasi TaxID=2719616 RepID=A0ABX1HI08_9BACT|nr:2-succinyl-5-enolpyruvyl-6-hydroxy-3-cyclohexene-1-carboxylic-acid synthase [Hymenobacter artigasi]NKI89847.1 2-succinyl-5-enolpyruvyl-6-hydroxy-3-cyclohexene-1-carboxylate synthase [Hymenobacter artigasi]